MNLKNLMVSFLIIVSVLFFATATVSANHDNSLANGTVFVEVDGILLTNEGTSITAGNPSVVTGDTIRVRVEFTSGVTNSDVTVEVELETDKEDVEVQTGFFDVENDSKYVKTLNLEVP